jgi:hypothetical protein
VTPPARTAAPAATAARVHRRELRIGAVLAEGGEGRVHQLPRQPHLVYKSYRRPVGLGHLDDLVAWPHDAAPPGAAQVVRSAAAWPSSVVVGDDGEADGLLMPRAPRRFALRHRDGHSRLASLSYLTADPEHRAVAYGLALPAPVTPERVGLAYALARLLAAFEEGDSRIAHGDLSTKNVLWSLQRGPEVFVLDCDSSERFTPDGSALDPGSRRRAMTPNWDDPSVSRGANPGPATDRYSLALVFLRIVGAANFPVQARQRAGGPVEIRFAVPAGPGDRLLLDPDADVWRLVSRSLSIEDPDGRPPASSWIGPLERLMAGLGGSDLAAGVRAAQGGDLLAEGTTGEPGRVPAGFAGDAAEVRIVPEKAPRRERTWTKVSPALRYGPAEAPAAPPIGYRGAGPTPAPVAPPAAAPSGPTAREEMTLQLLRFWRWWLALHRALWRSLVAGRRGTRQLRTAAFCAAIDFVLLVAGAALVALVVSPIYSS